MLASMLFQTDSICSCGGGTDGGSGGESGLDLLRDEDGNSDESRKNQADDGAALHRFMVAMYPSGIRISFPVWVWSDSTVSLRSSSYESLLDPMGSHLKPVCDLVMVVQDVEFIEYKAEAKASMDALEKKIDDDIRKLDVSIKAKKEESDAKLDVKIKELKKLILGTAPSQSTHVDHVPQITNVTANTAPVDPQAAIDREMQHVMETNQTRERVHRGAGTNQAGDRFSYHGFEHRWRNLKMPVFEGEDAYGWIYRVERNLYEQFLAITQEESDRAYVALFEKLACQLVGISESVMEATFIKGLKHALRAAVRFMNPEGLNNVMELAVSIEDNQLYEGVMQSKGVVAIVEQTTSKGDNFQRLTESEIQDRKAKGLCFRCEEKYTLGHRCASLTLQVMLVDESDEAEEPDLNFKS
nr:hypothetical protein [Tanacetum cinerariifolium]